MSASSTRAVAAANDNVPEVVDCFRAVFTSVKSQVEQGRQKTGLGTSQLWAMDVIDRGDGIGVGELAAAMSIHQSTASNLLRPLLEQGLVDAPRVADDRRAVRLSVTAAGRRLLRKAPSAFDGLLAQALATLDAPTLARLQRDLGRVAAALDQG